MPQALLVVDVQNEFSGAGQRPVANHSSALETIRGYVGRARESGAPIAWIKHHNRPTESRAFVPGTWGAELSPGFGPAEGRTDERLFTKDVFGAFTGTEVEEWLREREVTELLIVGFYTHMCVSTSAREALNRGFEVSIDAEGTGACELDHESLGVQSADEVRRTALLQLSQMGVSVVNYRMPALASV